LLAPFSFKHYKNWRFLCICSICTHLLSKPQQNKQRFNLL